MGTNEKLKGGSSMKRSISLAGWLALGLFLFASPSPAQHGHGAMKDEGAKTETKNVLVEGVRVSFMVMTNESHKKMLKDMKMKEDVEPGTTHNITVILKDEKTQKAIIDAEV